ncbi:MAG: hypothetical protein IKE36_03035, partial [Solobacterium sp.]|nr:hypothetical protein [Solobacterium sp.]
GNNPVSSYAILNKTGEDVTKHFTQIKTIDGKLTVDPAPLTVWTDSASKVYDGTPLTEPDIQIRTVPGYERGEPLWRDTALVGNASAGAEILYGICGTTWVHGTNPLTGEIREIELPAGKKMTVYLNDEAGEKSIEFVIEDMTEEDIPEEMLRLYADNPDLLVQACKDTGWDEEAIRKRIETLPQNTETATEVKSDLKITHSSSDRLMQDSTNVRIHIDTKITNYNGRALGGQEAHFTDVRIDPSIKIKATGSQTDVGQSSNTYDIDWGNANPNNYVFSEELGTLTVTPASLSVTTGSADKIYDGEPLTSEEAILTGLVNNETASITATGTITEPGTVVNSYTIDWGSAKSSNYSITEHLGTLTVSEAATVYDDPVTLTAESVEKVYDGTALTASSVKATGLPEGFTVQASCEGSQTDVGSSTASVSSYTILDPSGKDVTSQFVNVTVKSGTLTVTPAALTVTTGSAEKKYDGTPLTSAEASVTGLANGETATVTAEGSITEMGSADNTYTITWGTAKESNYTITEEIGTLTVTVQDASVSLTAASDEKTYDGTALANDAYTVEGLPPGFTVKAEISGSQTDAGSSANTVSSYTIFDASGKDVTAQFSNINTVSGTLTVVALPVVFDLACKELEYPVYTGSSIVPKGLYGTYTESGEEVEIDEEWDGILDDQEHLAGYIYTAHLTGGVDAIISVMAVTDAGKYEIEPEIVFTPDKKSNYAITYTNNILEIAPMEITFDLGGDKGGETITYFGGLCLPDDPTMIVDGKNVTGDVFEGIYEDGQHVGQKITYLLPGNYQVQLTYGSYKDAGTHTIKPKVNFPEGGSDNFKLLYTNETMTILKRPLTMTWNYDLNVANSGYTFSNVSVASSYGGVISNGHETHPGSLNNNNGFGQIWECTWTSPAGETFNVILNIRSLGDWKEGTSTVRELGISGLDDISGNYEVSHVFTGETVFQITLVTTDDGDAVGPLGTFSTSGRSAEIPEVTDAEAEENRGTAGDTKESELMDDQIKADSTEESAKALENHDSKTDTEDINTETQSETETSPAESAEENTVAKEDMDDSKDKTDPVPKEEAQDSVIDNAESSSGKGSSAIGSTVAQVQKQTGAAVLEAAETAVTIPQNPEQDTDTAEEPTEGDS